MSKDDTTKRFHRGNRHSVEANESAEKNKRRDVSRILALLHEYPCGLTCDEAEVLLNISHQTCSARFTDMKRLGWIAECGQRPTRTGNSAGVWRSIVRKKEIA